MEQLTLGQVATALAFVVGMISSVAYIANNMKKWIRISMKEQMDSLDNKLGKLNERLDAVDMESCKNYLVTFLSSVEKGSPIDEIEKERFWERFAHYEKMGGNSYIKRKVEELKNKGLL